MKQRYDDLITRKAWGLMAFVLLFLTSCTRDDNPSTPENDYLLESSVVTELSKEQISQQLSGLSPLIAGFVRNGVKVYRITYKTKNTDGSDITASGALILPVTTQPAAMVSVQHGTITSDNQAPSNFAANSEAATAGALFGALGYIIAYPDYIGYGASKDLPHPYEHRASLASSTLDMLRATKEFLKEQSEVMWDERLFVAGYSEGGYATLCLQKENRGGSSLGVQLAGVELRGGCLRQNRLYEVPASILPRTAYPGFNRSYLWVTLTYNRIYGLNRPASAFFKEPYASQIQHKARTRPSRCRSIPYSRIALSKASTRARIRVF